MQREKVPWQDPISTLAIQVNKSTSVFHTSVLLLRHNIVKVAVEPRPAGLRSLKKKEYKIEEKVLTEIL